MNNNTFRIVNPKVINCVATNNTALVQVRGNVGKECVHCFVEVGNDYAAIIGIVGPKARYNTIRVEWAAIEYVWLKGVIQMN